MKENANKLRAFRRKAGISQMGLAARSHVSIATVNRLENYPTLPLTKDTATKLAKALGVEVCEIFPSTIRPMAGQPRIWA